MGSEYRKPSASADEHSQHIPGVSSAATVGTGLPPVRPQSPPPDTTVGTGLAPVRPQGIPGGGRIEEPIYQEHGINSSGQPAS